MRRLLVIRDDNIGDAVLFSGALGVLRTHLPEAYITLVLRDHVCSLFKYCPHVDRVVAYERLAPWEGLQARGARGAWALEGMLRRVGRARAGRIDTLLCPVSAPREELVTLIDGLRAETKIGFSGYMLQYPDGRLPAIDPETIFTKSVRCIRDDRWHHESERLHAWLSLCGCDETNKVPPRLWLTDRDYEFAATGLPQNCSYIGAFLGASSHWRRWPVDRWCELLAAEGAGQTVVLLGGRDAAEDAREIVRVLSSGGQKVLNFCACTSLRELAACISRCACLISTESAGLHFAIAQDVPSVGITGQHHMGRYVPWGDPERHRIASVPCDRSDECTGACFYEDYRCIQDIPVSTVRHEVDALRPVLGS